MNALIIIAAILLVIIILYAVQPLSRRRFLANILRQVKYLIPRYFT